MSDSTVQCWLVERTFDDRNLVTIVYATPDGSRYQQQERSATSLQTGSTVTAAAEIPTTNSSQSPTRATRERYVTEVERTAEQYNPDDPI